MAISNPYVETKPLFEMPEKRKNDGFYRRKHVLQYMFQNDVHLDRNYIFATTLR